MLRRTNLGKIFLALLLSASFLLGWSVCVVLCGDAAEHAAHAANLDGRESDESRLDSAASEDGCTLTASEAILQERQTVETTVEAAKFLGARVRIETRPRLNFLSETHRHSPPERSPIPIFVKHCNFRI